MENNGKNFSSWAIKVTKELNQGNKDIKPLIESLRKNKGFE